MKNQRTLFRMRQSKLRDAVVVATFLVCLTGPGLLGLAEVNGVEHFTENRNLNPPPKLQWREPKKFVSALDLFLGDHFGLRPLFITAVNFAKLQINVSGNPSVVVGADNWLFSQCGPCQTSRSDVPQQWIDDYVKAFIERQRFVEAMGAHFTFFVATRKEMIYREYLPEWTRPLGPSPQVQDLRAAVQHSNMDVVYPIEAMVSAKKNFKLYYKYDDHWAPPGAMVGAKTLINHLHELYPQVRAFNDDDFVITDPGIPRYRYDNNQFDLIVLAGVPPLRERSADVTRRGGWTAKEQITDRAGIFTKDNSSDPTVVVYSDSFGEAPAFQQIVAEYFRRAVFVNVYSGDLASQHQFPTDILLAEKPDFVIYIRWELPLFEPTTNPPEVRDFRQLGDQIAKLQN
jgi:hypothetical protein